MPTAVVEIIDVAKQPLMGQSIGVIKWREDKNMDCMVGERIGEQFCCRVQLQKLLQ